MENLLFNELTITIGEVSDGVLRLDWLGKSSDRQPRLVLDPFFQEVTAAAQQANAAVEMHFEALEYFNSSTITTIIQVIQDFRAKNISLAINYDGSLKWQKLSFEALRIFEKSDGLLKITIVEPGAAPAAPPQPVQVAASASPESSAAPVPPVTPASAPKPAPAEAPEPEAAPAAPTSKFRFWKK